MARRLAGSLAVVLVAAAAGCGSLTTLTAILWPVEPTVAAKFPLAGKRVVLLCTPTPEILWAFPDEMPLLAESLARELRARVKRLDLVDLAQVRSLADSRPDFDSMTRAEIGRHFKADLVVELELSEFTLGKSDSDLVLRGQAVGTLRAADVHQDGKVLWQDLVDYTYPKTRPLVLGEVDRRTFLAAFRQRLAQHLARRFYDYPYTEEEKES